MWNRLVGLWEPWWYFPNWYPLFNTSESEASNKLYLLSKSVERNCFWRPCQYNETEYDEHSLMFLTTWGPAQKAVKTAQTYVSEPWLYTSTWYPILVFILSHVFWQTDRYATIGGTPLCPADVSTNLWGEISGSLAAKCFTNFTS